MRQNFEIIVTYKMNIIKNIHLFVQLSRSSLYKAYVQQASEFIARIEQELREVNRTTMYIFAMSKNRMK